MFSLQRLVCSVRWHKNTQNLSVEPLVCRGRWNRNKANKILHKGEGFFSFAPAIVTELQWKSKVTPHLPKICEPNPNAWNLLGSVLLRILIQSIRNFVNVTSEMTWITLHYNNPWKYEATTPCPASLCLRFPSYKCHMITEKWAGFLLGHETVRRALASREAIWF